MSNIKKGVIMKMKINFQFLTLLVLAGSMLILLGNCKKVGPSEWPAPGSTIESLLKVQVFDNDGLGTNPISGYDLKITYPDGSVKEFNNQAGTLLLDKIPGGTYSLEISKSGYIPVKKSIDIEIPSIEDKINTVYLSPVYLSKTAAPVSVGISGKSVLVTNINEEPTNFIFAPNSVNQNTDFSISLIRPTLQYGILDLIGNEMPMLSYQINPDMNFQPGTEPIVRIPIDLATVNDGGSVFLGNYNENTKEWTKIEGVLNADRTMAEFTMPHFSVWSLLTGYVIQPAGEGWTPWVYVAESDDCGKGASGVFYYIENLDNTVSNIFGVNSGFQIKISTPVSVGPIQFYSSKIYGRCKLTFYDIYDNAGNFIIKFNIPSSPIQWRVDTYYCHDQGGHDQGGGK